jgi:hypothetical protein
VFNAITFDWTTALNIAFVTTLTALGKGLLAREKNPATGTADAESITIPAQAVPGGLPAPSADPMHIDPTADPILQLARAQSPMAAFQQAIGAAVKKLETSDPALAAKIVPVFVTVDPARDTPAVLKQFVSAFHPRMVGLTGSDDQIARIKTEYAVYSSKGDPSPGGGYLVNHSRQAYLMDPDGKPIAMLPIDKGPDAVAAELAKWVK